MVTLQGKTVQPSTLGLSVVRRDSRFAEGAGKAYRDSAEPWAAIFEGLTTAPIYYVEGGLWCPRIMRRYPGLSLSETGTSEVTADLQRSRPRVWPPTKTKGRLQVIGVVLDQPIIEHGQVRSYQLLT